MDFYCIDDKEEVPAGQSKCLILYKFWFVSFRFKCFHTCIFDTSVRKRDLL